MHNCTIARTWTLPYPRPRVNCQKKWKGTTRLCRRPGIKSKCSELIQQIISTKTNWCLTGKDWRKNMPFVPRWFAIRRLFSPCLDQRMNQGCWSVVINSPNMPEPGTQCFESSLTCNLQQPLDRTNPNWRMVEIEKPTIFKCICS